MRPSAESGAHDAGPASRGPASDSDASIFQLANVALWLGDFAGAKARVDAWRATGVADVHAHLLAQPRERAEALAELRVTDCNDCAVELVQARGVTEALAGHSLLFDSEERAPLAEILQAMLERRRRVEFETGIRTLRGEPRRVRIGLRLPDTPAGWSRVVLSMFDTSSNMRTEDALREADRRTDELLATLAHELRNPLAPVRSAAKILESPALGARELAWCRDVIRRQVRHMALLLDDLLDVSRITRGKLELRRERVLVPDVVDAAVETARPLLEARRHTLELDLAPDLPALDADPLRISQALANLLTNAAKYTDPGGRIVLRARSGNGELRLAVRDNGIGLAPDARARMFEMFSQVRTALDRSEGGLGIGLALVRGLVELHGGRVEAHSEGPGRGSEFVVVLPVPEATAHAAAAHRPPEANASASAPAAVAAPPRRVLVADDNRDAAECLALLLRLAGHEVRAVHDGRAAVAVAAEFHPHAAVLDIGMPELNGYEVATHLRAQSWGRDLVLVAVTGWGQDGDRRRARVAGFDHHLTKPVDPERIGTLLAAAKRGGEPGEMPEDTRLL